MYKLKWWEQLNKDLDNSKLRTYVKFKTDFSQENYVYSVKCFEKRKLFTQLRISSHGLHIETGRYSKPRKTPVSERICSFCNDNKIEDEYHVVMACSLYQTQCSSLFENLMYTTNFSEMNDSDKFNFIMSYNYISGGRPFQCIVPHCPVSGNAGCIHIISSTSCRQSE